MLTITHTHEAGTLIDGTARGDGTAEILKANGWRWGRSIALWFIPQSRDQLPKTWKIRQTVAALEAAGFDVAVELDTEHRLAGDVEADKIARQAQRADALEMKAERKAAAADHAQQNARRALDALPPGGEPIKVGHHSEGRHRAAIARADASMRRSIDAAEDAEQARERAATAARTTAARYEPRTVARRIDRLAAEARKLERNRDRSPAGEHRDRLSAMHAETVDQLTYWRGVRAAQIAEGTATDHNRETVQKGDRVRVRGHWREVVRVNAKSVSVATGYSWTDTVPYVEIQELNRPA